ncbi:LOW QUALITY PROTEIN: uncharacterized protein [Ptychodera flava]|uniref:LOW QUALITY PROTEIN: uncharacterized protein n=1 Tax=Ptychodera flava TaxID=63121 RepID=UPI00396A7B64
MESKKGSEKAEAVGCPSETGMVGKAAVCEGCPGRELCMQLGNKDPDQEVIDVRMKVIKHKILILSGKGGVGKSSVAATLTMALAKLSKKVGLVDLDICGPSTPKLMNVEGMSVINSQWGWKPLISPHDSIKVMSVGSLLQHTDSAVVWRGPRKTQIIKRFLKDTLWGKLDFIVFDTPPGTSDEHLTVINVLKNSQPDGAVIVSTPQALSLGTIRKEITFCRKMGIKILGIVENMSGFVCPCCEEQTDLFSSGGAESLASEYGLAFLGRIPIDQRLTECCERGQSIFTQYPDSATGRALLDVANSVIEAVER